MLLDAARTRFPFDGLPLPALVYIPGREMLSRATDLTALVPRDAIAGEGTAALESPAGPLGVVISYEVLFADRVREAVTGGGRIVLVPTNATSYVTEDVPVIEVAGQAPLREQIGYRPHRGRAAPRRPVTITGDAGPAR